MILLKKFQEWARQFSSSPKSFKKKYYREKLLKMISQKRLTKQCFEAPILQFYIHNICKYKIIIKLV